MFEVKHIKSYKSDKIVSFKECIKLVEKIKAENKTVGLCHGGFDLLHLGHIKHFESAKMLCDILVVSITSDKFVSSRKGLGRPIFSDKLRAYMVANVNHVDYATISDFKEGTNVIKLLKPSFYIKGPDFINKTTPGITAERNAIKAVGGEMKYTNDPKLATTDIINYIKNEVDNKNTLVIIDRDGTIIKNDDFFGRNDNWNKEMEFNEDVVSFLSYLQTKYKTIKVVVSNQAGVARRFFDSKLVEKINDAINSYLVLKGIKIDNWQYCPFVDAVYASKHPEFNINPKFIQEKTKRKPSSDMLFDALKELNKNINEFDSILVIGNSDEDKGLAENLEGKFIDVTGKKYIDLVKILSLIS